jgi:hypothetical protein
LTAYLQRWLLLCQAAQSPLSQAGELSGSTACFIFEVDINPSAGSLLYCG